MILIGAINVIIGMCSYEAPKDPQRIDLGLTNDTASDAPNGIKLRDLPAGAMRAFAVKYPHTLPAGASHIADTYIIAFPRGASHHHATFLADGTFVSED